MTLLAHGLLALPCDVALSQDEEAPELPRTQPLEPSGARATFRLRADLDLDIELVASEPHVIDPVALAFDELARLWVVEMRDYPFTADTDNLTTSPEAASQPPGRVRVLEDADGDGRVDTSTVFLDGLEWPTAIACWRGGVLVAAAPRILWAQDHDGDGRADESRDVWTGFGRRNVQALLNGLCQGPDLRLWGNASFNGGEIRDLRDTTAPLVNVRGRDFRVDPDGRLEAAPSGRGQFGVALDDFGNRFICSNSDHARLVVIEGDWLERDPWLPSVEASERIAIDGGAAPVFRASQPEPWRVVRTRWRASSKDASRYPRTELVPTGFFTSATGLLVYTGAAYGPDLQGCLLIGDVGGNLVHRKRLERHGASFRARRPDEESDRELLTSTDNWFRPVQLVQGPDDAVYILDMYRETIEHPYSIPESLKARLSLTSGNDRGRIWRLVRRSRPSRERDLPGKADLPGLVRALESPNAWTRRTAARLIHERGDDEAPALLRNLISRSPSASARHQALWLLARRGASSADDVRRALADDHEEVRRLAIRLAESEGVALDALPTADASPRVRLQVALSAGELLRSDDGALVSTLRDLARSDLDDPWIRAAILASAGDRSARLLGALLATELVERPRSGDLLRALASRAAGDAPAAIWSDLLAPLAALPPSRDGLRIALLRGLGEGLARRGSTLGALLSSPPPERGVEARAVHALFEDAARRATDDSADTESRVAAIGLLACAPASRSLDDLARCLDPRQAPTVQVAAVRALGDLPGEEAVRAVLERWRTLGPAVRSEALEAVFRRVDRIGVVLDALEAEAIPLSDVDPARRKQLVDHPDEDVRGRARRLLARLTPEDRSRVVERHLGALSKTGDPRRGAELHREVCSPCHRAGGEGHAVAPDLETVRERDPENLLVHILDPNREVSPAYVGYTAVTGDGRILTGIIVEETATTVRLRRSGGVEDAVLRVQLARLESSGMSLMPANLEEKLDTQALADLIAFIRGLTPR